MRAPRVPEGSLWTLHGHPNVPKVSRLCVQAVTSASRTSAASRMAGTTKDPTVPEVSKGSQQSSSIIGIAPHGVLNGFHTSLYDLHRFRIDRHRFRIDRHRFRIDRHTAPYCLHTALYDLHARPCRRHCIVEVTTSPVRASHGPVRPPHIP